MKRRNLDSTNLSDPLLTSSNTTTAFNSTGTETSTNGTCKFCITESDLFQYLQGVYEGQRIINSTLGDWNKTCVQNSPELKKLYNGGL